MYVFMILFSNNTNFYSHDLLKIKKKLYSYKTT